MSALETKSALGVSFLVSDGPSDYQGLIDAITLFYKEIDRPPAKIVSLLRNGKIPQRAFRAPTFRNMVLDSEALEFHVGEMADPDAIVIECFLRPRNPDQQEFETRWITVTGTDLGIGDSSVRAFMTTIATLYPIAQGGVGSYWSLAYARQECSFSGSVSPFELDTKTRMRLKEDQMCRTQFVRKLRRLYPVTIIGPEIWAQLPPMPKVDPLPKIEDLGDCKMLTVWPELVEPRDPAFLAGTTELRRWLWPFTIQNPADAIDG